MSHIVLSLSCFAGWRSRPDGARMMEATLRQLAPFVDGYEIPLSYHELEDLGETDAAELQVPLSLQDFSAAVVNIIWCKPQSRLLLPPLSELVADTEGALADIMNKVARRTRLSRFTTSVTSREEAQRLTTLASNLSPSVSIIIKELIPESHVLEGISRLLATYPFISCSLDSRYWGTETSTFDLSQMMSVIMRHPQQYLDLRWSAASSEHPAYAKSPTNRCYLVTGSGCQIPSTTLEALPPEGSVIIEGLTPIEATPMLVQELKLVKSLWTAPAQDTPLLAAGS